MLSRIEEAAVATAAGNVNKFERSKPDRQMSANFPVDKAPL